ncbi:hypothetical protein [Sphingomonas sp.]|uniref:hypothetical protein n=1 Tax=Sphingomonas sp. TaxID=28214 RepID=UPI001B176830|nr:hypothetical protein [Sphingomonas sp.]MBO9712644.1 hypothetical protein [Sphingomonas sp.]
MAYVYTVQTNKGTYDVTVQQHHDHMSAGDFERALVAALLTFGSGFVLHRYSFKGRL